MSNMTDNVENEDENILKELFRKCDAEIRTGHVKAVDLINAIQGLVQDPIDCRLIDHLTSLMDPQNDNSYLDIGEFVLIGKKWFDIVRQFPNDEAEINGRTSMFSNLSELKPFGEITSNGAIQIKRSKSHISAGRSLIPIKKLTEIIAKPSNHSDSSLGILEIQDLETYSDDNEDLDKSRDSANVSLRLDALAKELEGLRRCNKKLTEEKLLIESQFLASEDAFFSLQRENDELKVHLRNLENVSEMKAELESKLNVQSESLTESDRKFTSMRTDLDEFRNLSTSLSDENMRLKEELERCQESLSVARMNCGDSCTVVDELTKKLESLKLNVAERTLAMEDLMSEKKILISKLNETKQVNERLEAEIELYKSQIIAGTENSKIFDTTTTSSINPEQLFDVSFDRPEDFVDDVFRMKSKARDGPTAFSTPFNQKFSRPMRGSIGDEIMKLGVDGSPLCDKKLKKETGDASTQTDNIAEPKPEVFVEAVSSNVHKPSRLFLMSGLALITILAFFTLFGGIDLGNTTLYPASWSPEWGLPEPFFAFKIRRRMNYW